MKKNVLLVVCILSTIGVLVQSYLVYNAILIEKKPESIPLYLCGVVTCLVITIFAVFYMGKNKKK